MKNSWKRSQLVRVVYKKLEVRVKGMAMSLREIAAAALDEWENETSVSESVVSNAEAEDFDLKAAASKAVRGAKGLYKDTVSGAKSSGIGDMGTAGMLSDLQEHDRKNHPDGYKGGRCKYRKQMAQTIQSMGLASGKSAEEVEQLKQMIGEANWKQDDTPSKGKVDPELNEIRNLVKNKRNEQDPTKREQIQKDIDAKRDAYYKRNMRDAEYEAVKGLEKCLQEQPNKVGKVLEQVKGIAEMEGIDDASKDAAENLIEKAEEVIKPTTNETPTEEVTTEEPVMEPVTPEELHKVYNEGMMPISKFEVDRADGKPLPPPTRTASDILNDVNDLKRNSGESLEDYENRVNDAVNNAQRELSDAGLNPEEFAQAAQELNSAAQDLTSKIEADKAEAAEAEKNRRHSRAELNQAYENAAKAYEDAVANKASEEEIEAAQQKMDEAKLAVETRQYNPDRGDLLEDLNAARAKLADLKSVDPTTGQPKGSEDEIADAEAAVSEAEETFRNFRPTKSDDGNGQANGGSANEYTINGKQYVDVSNMGLWEGMDAAEKAGYLGKGVITAWDKKCGRWDELVASDPKFAESLKALQQGTSGQLLRGGLAKDIEDKLKSKKLSNEERMALLAAQEAIASGKDSQKVMAEYQKAQLADKKAKLAEQKAKRDAELSAVREARAAEKHQNAEARANAREARSMTSQQVSLAKTGILPRGIDPNSEIGQLAARSRKKLDDAAEKARLALEKVKGKTLSKTYAETDPGIISIMENTANEMDATGEPVMQARASQIRNTLIHTLKESHDATDAYNAVHQFKKLIGVNDEGGKGGKDGGNVTPFTVPGVNHKSGGVVSGAVNAITPSMDTSCLDRSKPMSMGKVNQIDAAKRKIVSDFQTVAGMTVDPQKDIAVKNGVSATTLTVKLNGQRVNPQSLVDAIETGMGNIVGTKDANGKDKMPVKATYDRSTDSVNISFQNDEKGNVTFANLLDHKDANGKNSWNEFKAKNKGKGSLFVGAKEDGSPDAQTLEGLVHLMIAGQTGAGKSVKVHTIINSLFEGESPDDLKVLMVDPKGTEFIKYQNDPHLLDNPITNMDDASSRLDWMVDENENRAKLFQKAGVRSLADYNRKGAAGQLPAGLPQHLPRIALVVDELADLMASHGKEVEKDINRLSAKARSQGIHLILATQRPDTKVITGTVRANIPSTMGMSTRDASSSGVIGINGLENMQKGGPYALKVDNGDPTYGEGAYMSDDEIDGMVAASKKAYGGSVSTGASA